MTLTTISRIRLLGLIAILTLTACSSGKVVPTSDKCSLKKHYKDNIFQVLINGRAINSHWYTHPEAIDVTKELAKRNKCMKELY
jgi:hypothetical protein